MEEKKSFREKIDNYWYYYKYHTFAGIFAIIVLGIIIYSFATKDNIAKFVVADGMGYLNKESCKEILEDFANYIGEDEDELAFPSFLEYPNGEAAEIAKDVARVKGFGESFAEGDTDAVFILADRCFSSDKIGDLRNILPDETYNKLEENDKIMFEEQDTGEKIPVGIYVTGLEKFQQFFGDINDIIILQISEKSQNKENSIAFVKYIAGL